MGLSSKDIMGQVLNLTDEPIQAYSCTGEIVRLKPSVCDEKVKGYYLVVNDSKQALKRLLVGYKSKGRDGIALVSFFLAENPKVRVYPNEER